MYLYIIYEALLSAVFKDKGDSAGLKKPT